MLQVARLRVLIGGLEVGGAEIASTSSLTSSTLASKPRLRSLTPSAEKLRVLTIQQQQQQQQPKTVANGNESSKDQVSPADRTSLCSASYVRRQRGTTRIRTPRCCVPCSNRLISLSGRATAANFTAVAVTIAESDVEINFLIFNYVKCT